MNATSNQSAGATQGEKNFPELASLPTDKLLTRLWQNVFFCQYGSFGWRELSERKEIIDELDKREVRPGIISTVAHIGFIQGREVRDANWWGDPALIGFEATVCEDSDD